MIYTDQLGRKIELTATPKRVICLVPSITELLYDLGLEEEVIGITKFCVYPEKWFKTKLRVGGTKQVNFQLIKDLSPDLVIANKEENTKEMIEELDRISNVWVSDISNLSEANQMILSLGELLNRSERAGEIVERIDQGFKKIRSLKSDKTVKYFIWKSPDLLAGKSTFIDDMLSRCGLKNLTLIERYPEDMGKDSPDFVFLSSEPYPFKDSDISYFQTKYPKAKVTLVDGEMFSWYGSHLLKSPGYFEQLLREINE